MVTCKNLLSTAKTESHSTRLLQCVELFEAMSSYPDDGVVRLQKVKVDDRNAKGETARALAMMYGYTKIVSLIDSHSPRIKPGNFILKLKLN